MDDSNTMKPLLAITMGDVNGVGPEILAKAFARDESRVACTPIVIGNVDAYRVAMRETATGLEPVIVDDAELAHEHEDTLPFLSDPSPTPVRQPGVLSAEAGRCAMQWLDRAIELALDGPCDAIVTCPINKEGIHRAGYTQRGHTDYIAERTGSKNYRMCLFTPTLRVVHVSDHIALRDAIDLVRKDRIVESIRLGHEALGRLDLPRKRIAVAGLNPHAGEAGAFGSEERDRIAPAIEQCAAEGIDCSGPYPADTLFKRAHEGEFDLIVAMYHDQGHIPLKLIAMDEGVNVTLGIPIVRTSVAHGTAYDIAGTGRACAHSLRAAIALATQLAATKAFRSAS